MANVKVLVSKRRIEDYRFPIIDCQVLIDGSLKIDSNYPQVDEQVFMNISQGVSKVLARENATSSQIVNGRKYSDEIGKFVKQGRLSELELTTLRLGLKTIGGILA